MTRPLNVSDARASIALHAHALVGGIAMGATLFLTACGSHGDGAANRDMSLPDDCVSFVSAYQACFAAAAPSDLASARARAEMTRASLQQNAGRMSASDLAKLCRDNASQLEATCGNGRTSKE